VVFGIAYRRNAQRSSEILNPKTWEDNLYDQKSNRIRTKIHFAKFEEFANLKSWQAPNA
jgi:hypothetical protein